MSELASDNKSRASRRVKRSREDNEFLAAALEIIDTPASPTQIYLMMIIMLLAVIAIVWGYYGRIDIFAVATGKIRPVAQVQVVQPLETGRVRTVNVANGMHVRKGQTLVQLDDTEATADVENLETTAHSYRAEILRRVAVLEVAERGSQSATAVIAWPADTPPEIRAREERVLAQDLHNYEAQMGSYDAQRTERLTEQDKLRMMNDSESKLIATLQRRVDLRNALIAGQTGTESTLIDAIQSLQEEQSTFASDHGELQQIAASLKTLETEKVRTRAAFLSDNTQKLAEVERQLDDVTHRLVKARAAIEHMRLLSPIDGLIQSLAVTNVGQVVTTGQEILKVVPDDSPLEIEAYAENQDIGFLKEGQEAIIKVESFPFTRYGTIAGTVERVARDSIPSSDAQLAERDPTQLAKPNASMTSVGQTQNLVYPVIVKPSDTAVNADGQSIPLSAGMTVTVEIRTGSRRFLEYVFAPLVETGSTSLRER